MTNKKPFNCVTQIAYRSVDTGWVTLKSSSIPIFLEINSQAHGNFFPNWWISNFRYAPYL